MNGTVVRVIKDRGFGFIRTNSGEEIFFHAKSLPYGEFDRLTGGEEVLFSTMEDSNGRGIRARDVEVIG